MSSKAVAAWLVPLQGHQFDLEDLPLWTAGEAIEVVVREGTYNLSIPAAIVGTSPEPVRPIAEQQVEFINGIGRLLNPEFRPVMLSGHLVGIDAAGTPIETVVAVAGVEMRSKLGIVRAYAAGKTSLDPRRAAGAPFFTAAGHSSRARQALTLIGRQNLSWVDLYLLFELVEGDVGGKMYELDWISKSQERLFSQTANSYSALGLDGRHGKDRGSPPAVPMLHADAVVMVRNLVRVWLEYLAAGKNSLQSG